MGNTGLVRDHVTVVLEPLAYPEIRRKGDCGGEWPLALDPLPRAQFFKTEEASMVTKMAALVVMCLVLVNGMLAPAHAQGKAVLFEDNFATLNPI